MLLLANIFGALSDIAACLQSHFASHGLDAYGWFGFSSGMVLATVMVFTPKFQFKWISGHGLDGYVGGIFVLFATFTGHLLGVAYGAKSGVAHRLSLPGIWSSVLTLVAL